MGRSKAQPDTLVAPVSALKRFLPVQKAANSFVKQGVKRTRDESTEDFSVQKLDATDKRFSQVNTRKRPRSKSTARTSSSAVELSLVVHSGAPTDDKDDSEAERRLDSDRTLLNSDPDEPAEDRGTPEVNEEVKGGDTATEAIANQREGEGLPPDFAPFREAERPDKSARETPRPAVKDSTGTAREKDLGQDVGHPLLFSPATSQTVVVPAYLRASKEAPKLPLPPSHELLCKFFDELETMLRYLRARSQPCILSKFKQRVESSVRRSFEISHLEQIVNVFPEAFVFKALNPSESWERKLNLIIEISEDEVPQTFLEIGQASARRLAIFRQRLHSHALPYMKQSAPAEWDLQELPAIPRSEIQVFNSRKAREDAKKQEPQVPTVCEEAVCAGTPVPGKPKASSLLERIRAKEEEKRRAKLAAAKTALGDVASLAERAMVSRMPDVAKTLSVLFSVQRRTVLLLGDVSEKLSASLKTPLSHIEAANHVVHLAKLCPEFCEVADSASGRLVKLVKGARLETALAKLSSR